MLVDSTCFPEDRNRIHVLLHEMLHALGRAHVDRHEFPDTILHQTSKGEDHEGFLKGLDKAALCAFYSPLVPVGTKAHTLCCDGQGRVTGRR